MDEAEIYWGDSITKKVNEGLVNSKYVVVVISVNFLNKHWPQRELSAVLNQEASSREVKILPLLVGVSDVLQELPLLRDKLYLSWNNDPQPIVGALGKRLGKPVNFYKLSPQYKGGTSGAQSVMVTNSKDVVPGKVKISFVHGGAAFKLWFVTTKLYLDSIFIGEGKTNTEFVVSVEIDFGIHILKVVVGSIVTLKDLTFSESGSYIVTCRDTFWSGIVISDPIKQ